MKSCGGYRGCFDLDDEGITKRLAVLTIHPCSHLIKLHEYLGNGFPMFLINSRWIKKELDGDIHNFTELNTEINSFNDDDIEVEID